MGVVAPNIMGRCLREYRNKMICDMIRIKCISPRDRPRRDRRKLLAGKARNSCSLVNIQPESPSCTLDGDNDYDVLCEYPSFSLAVSRFLSAQKKN